MKPTIQNLKDTVKISYDFFEDSMIEAKEVIDLYHNKQYTEQQKAILKKRNQPIETFNVIKLFTRLLLGYYSTIINTVKVKPKDIRSAWTASLLNDVTQYTFRKSNFMAEGDKIKMSGFLTGLMAAFYTVSDLKEKDKFGRPYRQVYVHYVPPLEILLDPFSKKEDYSDARYIHRFKWVTEDGLKKLIGEKKYSANKDKLQPYHNFLSLDTSDITYSGLKEEVGYNKMFPCYLIVHSMIEDGDDIWSVLWHNDWIISKDKVKYNITKFPYRVHRLNFSDDPEYYGIFREIVETQKAINQALLKIQLMINTNKVLVEKGAVDNLEKFKNAFNRVSGIIPVNDLNGIKVENLNPDIANQYIILDKAFDRIQKILGINDSFLGMAYASDSGRKVKLQQNATIMALKYITSRIEHFYELLGWDIVKLIQQFYTANQIFRIADEWTGERWIEINRPIQIWTGQIDKTGKPVMEHTYTYLTDPKTGKPMKDSEGNILVVPINDPTTEIKFTDFEIEVEAVAYNDEDEKAQLMLESMLSSNIGNLLAQIDPAGYFKIASYLVKLMGTRYSPNIAAIFEGIAMRMQDPQAEQLTRMLMQQMMGKKTYQGQQRMSAELKLPQNTNEGV